MSHLSAFDFNSIIVVLFRPFLTLRRGTRCWFRFPLDSRNRWLRRVGAVLRGLVSPRRRRSRRACGRIIGSGISANVIGGRGAGAAATPDVAVTADFTLKVQPHLHFHHFGRALDQIDARARLQILTTDFADRRVRRTAQLPGPTTLPLRRRQR